MPNLSYLFTYVNDQDIDSFLENQEGYANKIAFLGSSGLISTHGEIYGDAISEEAMSYINDKFESSYSYILDLNNSMNETSYVINKAIINLNDRINTSGVWEKGTGTLAVQTKNANNNASGNYSVAEGTFTKASGKNSHAEGTFTKASGKNSHAEGYYAKASGQNSHAEGSNTQANNYAEHASGEYNKSNTNTLFSVGNGHYDDDNEDEVRQNAFEIMRNGDMYIYGVNKYDGKSISSKKTVQNYLANIGKNINIGDLSFLTESEVESIFIDNIIINIDDEDRMIIFGKLIRNVINNGQLTGEQHLYIGVPHGTDMTDIDIKFYRYCKVINRNKGENDSSNRTKYKGLHEIWNGRPVDAQPAITPVFVDNTTVDFEQNNYDYYEVGGYCEWDNETYDNFREYCEEVLTSCTNSDGDNLHIWQLLVHKHNYLCLVKDNQIISGFIPINCNYNQNDSSISLKL